jgi:hypothetical protein
MNQVPLLFCHMLANFTAWHAFCSFIGFRREKLFEIRGVIEWDRAFLAWESDRHDVSKITVKSVFFLQTWNYCFRFIFLKLTVLLSNFFIPALLLNAYYLELLVLY